MSGKSFFSLRGIFPRRNRKRPDRRYHAVEIRAPQNSCAAVQRHTGDRYLSAEAPLLPVPTCDRPEECSCRYVHFADRRSSSRRSSDDGLPAAKPPDGVNRRRNLGRRESDLADTSSGLKGESYFATARNRILSED